MKFWERATTFSAFLRQDYDYSHAVRVRKKFINTITIFLLLLLLLEASIDLNTSTIPILASFLTFNTLLAIAALKAKQTYWLAHIQIILTYGIIETHVIYNPTYFHTMIYWMPIIPMFSIILISLRASYVWLVITLLTILLNVAFGHSVIGRSYSVSPRFVAFGIGGVIFIVGFYLAYTYLYSLAGNYFLRLQSKNREIKMLNDELNDLNNNLEKKVSDKIIDIKEQNERLERFAFMNAHIVRAPLANIIGALSLYNESEDMEQKQNLLLMINESAYNLDDAMREVAKELNTNDSTDY